MLLRVNIDRPEVLKFEFDDFLESTVGGESYSGLLVLVPVVDSAGKEANSIDLAESGDSAAAAAANDPPGAEVGDTAAP